MQRMTGIDPMFIYSDTPETPMEIAYACVFDPSPLPGGYSFERVTGVLQTRIPTLQPFRRRLVPVPLGLDHPRLGRRPRFRPRPTISTGGSAAPGRRRGVPRPGGPGDEPAAHAGAAAVGDARRRGHGRRQRRAHRQDPSLRRSTASPAPRCWPSSSTSTARGQRGDRALPALAAAPAALADRVDDRCAAELHPQPAAGAACRARSRPYGRAAGPLRQRRAARPGLDPAGARPTHSSRPWGRPRRGLRGTGPGRRCGCSRPLRLDHQRRGAGRLLGCARARTWSRTVRTPRARWWRSSRSRCGATRGGDAAGKNQLSAMFVALSNDSTRRWSGCAR